MRELQKDKHELHLEGHLIHARVACVGSGVYSQLRLVYVGT